MTFIIKDPLLRKLLFVQKVTTPDGIWVTYQRFKELLDLIRANIGLNLEFSLLIDIPLTIDLPSIFQQLEFHPKDFSKLVVPYPEKEFLTYQKGYYGETYYDFSFFDPPEVTTLHIERYVWNLTYHSTLHDSIGIKQKGKTLKQLLTIQKDVMAKAGVSKGYLDALEYIMANAEARLIHGAYWGVACWDVSSWIQEKDNKPIVKIRDPQDWETEIVAETECAFETLWDCNCWDYAHWYGENWYLKEEVEQHLDESVKSFHQRIEPLWQGTFLLQKSDSMHYSQAYHQVRLQHYMRRAKNILCRLGVVGIQHKNYLAFLQELLYLKHEKTRKHRMWKKLLTKEDIIDKWVKLGLNRSVLETLAKLVV